MRQHKSISHSATGELWVVGAKITRTLQNNRLTPFGGNKFEIIFYFLNLFYDKTA